MAVIGRSVRRIEDPPLLMGQGRFAADISLPHQLHMRVARSAQAYGRLRAIDTSRARAMPGVVAVWNAQDVAGLPPIDIRLTSVEGLGPYRQSVLASGRVRYVGEPVAVVFALDSYLAEDAAERIVIEVEEWPPMLRADQAPQEFD